MGKYPEHLKELIFEDMTGLDPTECDSGLYEEYDMDNAKKEDFEKPKCYAPNDDLYSLCKGAINPVEFAENDCIRCNLYENMDENKYETRYDD